MAKHAELPSAFVSTCRQNGLKITPQRVAIYHFLRSTREHPSATDVYRAIKSAFPNISFETVNRTLLTFNEIGLVETVHVSDKRKRFDAFTHPHHHIFCVKCRKIVDVDQDALAEPQVPAELRDSFSVLRTTITFEAMCTGCVNA